MSELKTKTSEIKLSWSSEFTGLVIVISCAEKDYRTAWAVNKVLEIHLAQMDEIAKSGAEEKPILFSRFEYWDEEQQKNWRMLSNRSDYGTLLAPEYRNFDYLIFAFGDFLPGKDEEILERLRSVRFITSAYTIPPSSLKAKDLLLI